MNAVASGCVETPKYADVEDLIETIVGLKVQRWSFPGMDSDDIAQEVRIICWQALDKYDVSKEGKGMFYYLAKCVDNRLFNKGRGIYFDNNPPCMRCPYYNKESKECCGSQRYVDYQKRMARRRAIDNPRVLSSMSDDDGEFIGREITVGSLTGVIDLDAHIRNYLDDGLLPYYEAIVAGDGSSVPISVRRKLRQQLEGILD